MCGRFGLWADSRQIAEEFSLGEIPGFRPAYNMAPSHKIPAVGQGREGERSFARLIWGLKPHWFKQGSQDFKMINARADSMFDKPAFRAAARKRRCLIPASCFFEWKKQEQGAKQPYCIRPMQGELFAFAGIWEYLEDPHSQEMIYTCAIVTTRANEAVQPLHNRMPVIVPRGSYSLWLDKSVQEPRFLKGLFEPVPGSSLKVFKVGHRVNNPANDDQGLVVPVS
ncbi:SOS response-associated peptidase [Desulfonatronospira sp.]|uniref:SOS response-associated peptidase n=1 Tax=Desulfonatronospira sp. TaxID=1962951 RepID=UPI0025B89B82|nr:SOS response-associated peptidase [Desulfonatronospira sp.]